MLPRLVDLHQTAADVKDVNLSEQRKITDELKVKVGDKPSQIYSKEDIKKNPR